MLEKLRMEIIKKKVFFGNPVGISWEDVPIKYMLKKWWDIKSKTLAPSNYLTNYSWRNLLGDNMESEMFSNLWRKQLLYKEDPITNFISSKMGSVQGKDLYKMELQINTDGSRDAIRRAGTGWICRDHRGKIIMTFARSIGRDTSNMAEAKASLNGLEWCSQNGHSNVILDCDSKIVVEMIKGNYNIPWQMKNIITRIQNISSTITCEVRHCYREANQVADALAKWSITNEELVIFAQAHLPSIAIGPYKLDLIQMESLRNKQRKNYFV
ncbi:hypothetical protein KY290_007557 [Solanum tuberosum]|uniref:RNase H type-1 domain-containing protein n=1 Tax=Solanum tuberosum TaxID=4113 RepID=A0ABQ7W7B3_SOLTU|nr:hypothetical protein KY290_007557 [Solanum tuberosum]